VLHEFGHFAAAKAVGMRVERFALFFPPLVVKTRRGETEYGIGAIPLGGYVKISGMNPNEELSPEVAPRAYFAQPVWKRVVVIAAGPLMNVLIAFVILWALFAFQGVAKLTKDVGAIDRGTPAAGRLMQGDRLVAVDGRRGDNKALSDQVNRHRCAGRQLDGCRAVTPARVTVLRDGRERTLSLRPYYDASNKRARLGFTFAVATDKQGPAEAVSSSVTSMWRVTSLTVTTITRLFYDSQARKEVSGPVGTYKTTQETIKRDDAETVASLLALISLSLAIVNLFPFLPLDGGHIFWAVAEKLRGRAIAFSVMERASVVGFVLVIFLFVIGFSNDLGRLQGQGFGVR